MSAINASFFESVHVLNSAQGGASEDPLKNGGIIDPQERLIAPSTTLIRFGAFPKMKITNSKGQKEWVDGGGQYFGDHVASGQWWLDWRNYKLIEDYADQIGESVTYAVRQTCAVPKEWSEMSFLVQAFTRSPLLAYTGFGRAANIRDDKAKLVNRINPSAGNKPLIKQLFIPGLNYPDLRRDAIYVQGTAPLDPDMSHKGQRRLAERDAALRERLRAAVKPR